MTAEDVLKAHAAVVAYGAAPTFPERIGVLLALRNNADAIGWPTALAMYPTPCPDVRDPEFQRVLDAVDGVFDGTRPDDLVNGGWTWRSTHPDAPARAGTSLQRAAQIGQMIFYK